jgi:DNA primase
MIEQESIENLKNRLDVVDVVASYIELKKSGANFKANCPFHGENTPSFVVSPSKQIYHCFGCLAPYEYIRTIDGLKKIENIEVGDFVFASNGKATKVIRTLKHKPQYEMLKFKTDLINDWSHFTSNHDMVVVSKNDIVKNLPYIRVEKTRPLKFYGVIKKRVHIKPYSINSKVLFADDVVKGDYFLYPVDRDILDKEVLDVTSFWEKKKFGKNVPKIDQVILDEELMWLFGMYVAEGSTYRGGIKFSFHSAEINYAERIVNILKKSFDKKASLFFPKNRENSLEVTCSSTNLEYIFKALFSKGAENKKYPYFFNYLKTDFRQSLFQGLMDGDGCHERRTYKTVSKNLSYLLVDLAISLEKIPALYKSKKFKDKNNINHKKSYTLLFHKRESLKGFFEQMNGTKYLFMRVKDIEKADKEDIVYDITVEDSSHTFLTKNFIVGNCGVGGDAIKFVMEYEKLNYPEAIEKLAGQYNVELRHTEKKKDHFSGEKKIVEDLNLFFRKNLDQNADAERYLTDRGIYESSIEKFEIGYAPESHKTLDYMRSNSVSYTDSKDLGLVAVSENGKPYARFSKRITFPIFTPNGKIVGFGGRTITDHPAKYINSPQSKIFDKSRLLYGYHKAKTTILQKGEVIVTEGYLDVIMLHQAGFTNAVASLGTALTEQHVPILSRGNPKVILAYDGDKAGREAAFKASVMLSARGMSGGVVIFGAGLDPADMVKNHQMEDLNKLFHAPKPLIEYALGHIISKYNIKDPIQKEEALKDVTNYLQTLTPLLQEEYKGYVGALLGVNERLVRVIKHPLEQQPQHERKEDISELSLIKTFLTKPHMIDTIMDTVGENLFQRHLNEFKLILQGAYDNPLLLGIKIRDDLIELNDDELKHQIRVFLTKHNKEGLLRVSHNRDISFEKKSFYLRKIKENLKKLGRGDLVPYEDFGNLV